MVHDWLYVARHCIRDGTPTPEQEKLRNVDFNGQSVIMAEAIKALINSGKVKKNDFAGETITGKITINVGFVDLGHIDLLVREGFYSNRTDFIRTAIRNQLAAHADAVKQSIVRHTLELGLRRYSREELEAVKTAGGRLHIQVVGLATIAEDVTPELALATIESITVLGALHASKAVKAALSDRIG